jgi:limonene-1,2-epoxide hydrolase
MFTDGYLGMKPESRNIDKVRAFIGAWNRCDRVAIIAAFADEAIYHNVPMAPIRGRAAISAAVARILEEMSGIEWKIVHIAETENGAVLTERVDSFRMRGRTMSVSLMGVFELREGLIMRWSEYFDLGQYQAQLASDRPSSM